MSSRLLSLLRKEFLQFFRDRMLVILIVYTFVEPILCGVSLFLDVKHITLAVYDADRTAASRELISKLATSEHFDLRYSLNSQADLRPLLDSGRAKMAVVIPTGFGRDLVGGESVHVQLIADGSNANIAAVAIGYAERIIGAHSRRIELHRLGVSPTTASGLPGVVNQIRARYDPDLRFTNFNMVSMVAFAAPVLGILLGSVAIVREKEAGTMEQLLVTPIRPWELISAKLLPLGVVKMVGLAIGVAIAVWGFQVPVRGSLGLYFVISILAFIVGMGMGIVIGTVANNMQQSLLLAFFVIFPMSVMSGMMAPLENMPTVLQWLSLLSPFRYYMAITIGVFIKGVGVGVLWPQVLGLGALGVAVFTFSLSYFRRSLHTA